MKPSKKTLARRQVAHVLPGTSPLLSRLFVGRGVSSPEELETSLSHLLPPHGLRDIDTAAALVCRAITQDRKMLILGDFDADGATSCALLVSGLAMLGAKKVDYLVPDRFKYGYGMTREIVDVAAKSAPDLLITVDNGISSVDGVAHALALGIEVLITDHHLPGPVIPAAAAIVNPNHPECTFQSKSLAGVGVAFYLLSAVRTRLREEGFFKLKTAEGSILKTAEGSILKTAEGSTLKTAEGSILKTAEGSAVEEPQLAGFLDLVALGTIADLVPLDRNNRILVAEGIKRMRRGLCRPGIKALMNVAGLDCQYIHSRDLGFKLAPRLNAAGRLQDMSVGIACLLADESEAPSLATQLDQLNTERRTIEVEMQHQAESHVAKLALDELNNVGLTLYHEDWHQGILGIVAARVKNKCYRPVVAFAKAAPDELKGSARSIQGFHIRDAFEAIATRNPGLVLKFGGHAMAAGLSLRPEQLEKFREEFDQEARHGLDASLLTNRLWSDGEIEETISVQLAEQIGDAAPWGQGFPEPIFDGVFEVFEQRIVGDKHLKLTLAAEGDARTLLDAICFNHPELLDSRRIKCAYRLEVNRFRGRVKPQLVIEGIF